MGTGKVNHTGVQFEACVDIAGDGKRTPFLMGATHEASPCGCEVVGNGTLTHPLAVERCEAHEANGKSSTGKLIRELQRTREELARAREEIATAKEGYAAAMRDRARVGKALHGVASLLADRYVKTNGDASENVATRECFAEARDTLDDIFGGGTAEAHPFPGGE